VSAESEEAEGGLLQSFKVAFGYTYIPDGVSESGDDQGVWVPTIGIAYKHKIKEPWSLGAALEVELDSYLVEDVTLTRENPAIIIGLAYLEALPRFELFVGGGIEADTEEVQAVFRGGAGYEFVVKETWIVVPIAFFDFIRDYPKYTMALEFGKKF